MPNDFANGALKAEDGEEAAVAVRGLIECERKRNTEIDYTKDLHGENYLDTQKGKRLPVPPHCIRGTRGAKFADGVYAEGAKALKKEAFASVALAEYARGARFDEILLAGICTDICVVSNALLSKPVGKDRSIRLGLRGHDERSPFRA